MKVRIVKQDRVAIVYFEGMIEGLRGKGGFFAHGDFYLVSELSAATSGDRLYFPGTIRVADTDPAVMTFPSNEDRDDWVRRCTVTLNALRDFRQSKAPATSQDTWEIEL